MSVGNTCRPSGTWIRPRRAAPCTPSRRLSTPSNVIEPRWATSPEIAFSVDVLPAPFGPIMATTSPVARRRGRCRERLPPRRTTPRRRAARARSASSSSSTPRYASTTRWSANTASARPDRDELPELEDRDAVAQRRDEVELVVDEQDRDAVVAAGAAGARRAARSRSALSPADGSSSISAAGSAWTARASSSSRRWPYDSRVVGSSARLGEPDAVERGVGGVPPRAVRGGSSADARTHDCREPGEARGRASTAARPRGRSGAS